MTKENALLLVKNKNCDHMQKCRECIGYRLRDTLNVGPLAFLDGCTIQIRKILISRLIRGESFEHIVTRKEYDSVIRGSLTEVYVRTSGPDMDE